MNRKDAIAHGYHVHDINHQMKRRAPWHDYRHPGYYMLTLVVEGRRPLFGRIESVPCNSAAGSESKGEDLRQNYSEPRNSSDPRERAKQQLMAQVVLSPLGEAIANEEIRKISQHYPLVKVVQLCVMPDHLHIILHVDGWLKEGQHLGMVVNGFKYGCNHAWWRIAGIEPAAEPQGTDTKQKGTDAEPKGTDGTAIRSPRLRRGAEKERRTNSGRPGLFEPGYNDRLLFDGEQMERWKHYLDDNPRRLAIKRQHPDLFIVKHGMRIADHDCQIVGNQFLLDIPDKVAVIVHRRYTEKEYQWLTEQWLACGERGGVLVSAAISPKERAVLQAARERDYNIIWLKENGFPEYYKPTGKAFDACSAGRLLQVCPWEYHTEERTISRKQCLELNAMAIALTGGETTRQI